MRKQWKSFWGGFLICLLLVSLIGSAAATVGRKTVEVDYNNIKVTMNGKAVVLADANGNAVEPFAISGTTYLPVRAVATALGLQVGWDGATNTVVLSSNSTNEQNKGSVIYNKDGIKITFLGFQDKKEENQLYKGWNIRLKIENASTKDYTVQVRDLSVNGMMADSIFSVDVSAGKSAMDSIWVINMEEKGITTPITEAEFHFQICESGDWLNSFPSDTITVK